MAKRLYLMRHAVTDMNINKIWTGHMDISIAKEIHHPLISLPDEIDAILCSSAQRCKETVQLMNTNDKLIIFDSDFIECGYGKYTGHKKSKKLFVRNLYNRPESSDIFCGESRLDGGLRSYKKYIKLIEEFSLAGKNVLILSHKNTLCGFWVWFYIDKWNRLIEKVKDPSDLSTKDVETVLKRHPIPSFDNLKTYVLH